jgi:hypothetical protein
MSIDPSVWGEPGWVFLHSIALTYPNKPSSDDKKNIKNFFTVAGKVLPCHRCRDNYKKHLTKFPLNDKAVSSRLDLVTWLNNVNQEVDKEVAKMKKQLAVQNKKQQQTITKTSVKSEPSNMSMTLIIVMIVCALIYYLIKKTN